MPTRKPAKRPAPRTVHFALNGTSDYTGWEATAKVDFPAAVLFDLESGELPRIIKAMDRIVTDHNMPDDQGKVATTMAEVDPVEGMMAVLNGLFDAMAKLPNR